MSQMRTLLSRLPAATKRLLGEMATVVTPSSMVRVVKQSSVARSHRRMVRSPEPEAMKRPSEEKSRE